MSKSFLGRCLSIVAIVCCIAAMPALAISAYVGYYLLVPRYSAVGEFDQYDFNLRLDLFLSNDEARDSGRYLSVITGGSYHTVMIPGWDWAHAARTSVYRVDDNRVAVLSAFGTDEMVALRPFAVAPVVSDRGDRWQYLGAFDFAFARNGRPRLQFFDAGQVPECIPMGSDEPSRWGAKPRSGARRATCPTPNQP